MIKDEHTGFFDFHRRQNFCVEQAGALKCGFLNKTSGNFIGYPTFQAVNIVEWAEYPLTSKNSPPIPPAIESNTLSKIIKQIAGVVHE
jgi:hypothetical protein